MNLVLDMDQTLISGCFDKGAENSIIIRPYLKLFLAYAFNHFEHVSIWTSAKREWYDEVNKKVFQQMLPKDKSFAFVWTRETCIYKKIYTYLQSYEVINVMDVYVKPLEKIYEKFPSHTRGNTLIVDDNPHSYSANIGNSVPIPGFRCDDVKSECDNELLKLVEYFDSPVFQENILTLRASIRIQEAKSKPTNPLDTLCPASYEPTPFLYSPTISFF